MSSFSQLQLLQLLVGPRRHEDGPSQKERNENNRIIVKTLIIFPMQMPPSIDAKQRHKRDASVFTFAGTYEVRLHFFL